MASIVYALSWHVIWPHSLTYGGYLFSILTDRVANISGVVITSLNTFGRYTMDHEYSLIRHPLLPVWS